jgi:hypothetical protein
VGIYSFAAIPELRLTALEAILSEQDSDRDILALYYARDVVVLHNCDELSLDDIRESLFQYQADRRSDAIFDPGLRDELVDRIEVFSDPILRAVRNRLDGLPARLRERDFPEIRAMLRIWQRRKNNALNRPRRFRDAFEYRDDRW